MDLMADETSIIDSIDLKIKAETLYKFIKEHLDLREQQILMMRYGLFSTIPLTQREVANELNISRSYVSRLEKKALEKLRVEFDKTNQ
ncbi:MAG: sigma-70 family RNA polymerase sigma factor [Oscillospiraceae bacterium]